MYKWSFISALLLWPAGHSVYTNSFALDTLEPDHATQPLLSDVLEKNQAAQIIAAAGFPKNIVPLVTCLAEHESHFNIKAIGDNENRTHDYGLLQINSVWLKKEGCDTSGEALLNPKTNAACAYKIYKTQGLTAWSTYKTYKNTCLAYKLDHFDSENYLANRKMFNKRIQDLM